MSWVKQTLNSTLGQKVIMSLTGLFLVTFLIVHLIGNLQILKADGGDAFNVYAAFMSTNGLIHAVSYGMYAAIIAHVVYAITLTLRNKKARPVSYAVQDAKANSSWASRSMMLLGSMILVFLVLHLVHFWAKYKMGWIAYDFKMVTIEGVQYRDIASLVIETFKDPIAVGIYVLGLIGLGFHLNHGFQSAFQTLGLNHKSYNNFIKGFGAIFSIVMAVLYAVMPLYVFFS
ncbi:succinate dehydrogenase cytochrome b subunit [Persicobacter sp. CCB-QB2]|uniref:succinate dehydrogenase cytochrome b subunit n=1 Tax=Persicobacter sp. CCB-QB2 TaxID=1561025 RepID=UPI0006A9B878|nr:succinate dehydrogenase cytochrome b subunit [Persicobacter sp. CCB-QB2]